MRRLAALAAVCTAGVVGLASAGAQQGVQLDHGAPPPPGSRVQRGAALFAEGCSSCHGTDARGVRGRGPSLRGAGAASVDFYLRTGRMPLAQPGVEPTRAEPVYDRGERAALTAFVTSLAPGGPAIPRVDPARGDIALGRTRFTDSCSGCHQIVAQGGIAPGLVAPPLDQASPTEIGEAIRVGPYLMPKFGARQLDAHEVDSIARYVREFSRRPPNRGGLGIGNVGPIPEGIVAFLLGGVALVLVARIIGERSA